ncbi:hypothetical protein QBC47DRAFT_417310 [Echria macrotheca]|uniref:Uncharacterized protein n=1 Tax=Echria macrotheca TaxID=438768 RepID=A0AAJ0F7Q1_9PEZI|nr:hypothetical protein QBC47DRAFT_417310 [Echria macrotheca]
MAFPSPRKSPGHQEAAEASPWSRPPTPGLGPSLPAPGYQPGQFSPALSSTPSEASAPTESSDSEADASPSPPRSPAPDERQGWQPGSQSSPSRNNNPNIQPEEHEIGDPSIRKTNIGTAHVSASAEYVNVELFDVSSGYDTAISDFFPPFAVEEPESDESNSKSRSYLAVPGRAGATSGLQLKEMAVVDSDSDSEDDDLRLRRLREYLRTRREARPPRRKTNRSTGKRTITESIVIDTETRGASDAGASMSTAPRLHVRQRTAKRHPLWFLEHKEVKRLEEAENEKLFRELPYHDYVVPPNLEFNDNGLPRIPSRVRSKKPPSAEPKLEVNDKIRSDPLHSRKLSIPGASKRSQLPTGPQKPTKDSPDAWKEKAEAAISNYFNTSLIVELEMLRREEKARKESEVGGAESLDEAGKRTVIHKNTVATAATEFIGAAKENDTPESSAQGKAQGYRSALIETIQERERKRLARQSLPEPGREDGGEAAGRDETQQVEIHEGSHVKTDSPVLRPYRHLRSMATHLWNLVSRVRRPKLAAGEVRITWKCKCGDDLWIDVPESCRQAAEAFAIQAAGPNASKVTSQCSGNPTPTPADSGGSSTVGGSATPIPNLTPSASNTSTASQTTDSSTTGGTETSRADSPNTTPSKTDETNPSPPFLPAGTKKYMLLCVNTTSRRGLTLQKLANVDVTDVECSGEMFQRLRTAYEGLRTSHNKATVHLPRNPFLIPRTMYYIRFELLLLRESGECVGNYETGAIPSRAEVAKHQYAFSPCPPRIGPLPLPPNIFMHGFLNPGDHLGPMAVEMLPKKLWSPLRWDAQAHGSFDIPAGWGFYIVEGINWPLVSWCAAVALLGVTVLTVVWSVLAGDVQGGTGLGQYCLAVLTLSVSMWLLKYGVQDV